MAPVLEPPDEGADDVVIAHNAEAHRDAFGLILTVFGKTVQKDQIIFLVSDNYALNKILARLLDVPLVGCARHRLNLVVSIVKETTGGYIEQDTEADGPTLQIKPLGEVKVRPGADFVLK